jgi:prephenate dehydrogenase
MRLGLVGTGHIGGSLALALRRAGHVAEIVGHEHDPEAAARARARGIVDRLAPLEELAALDLVVLAVPVRQLGACLAALPRGPIVTDVGSTKAGVVAAGEGAHGGRFLGGHPLAGTERAGPDAADGELFRGRRVLITPTAHTGGDARAAVEALWRAAGATVTAVEADRHDRMMAAVSHLPHVVAYVLAAAVGDLGEDLAGFSAGGFKDTTRIASTPAGMWIDVFLENRGPVLDAVAAFRRRLDELEAAIVAGDPAAIDRHIAEARAARARILGG